MRNARTLVALVLAVSGLALALPLSAAENPPAAPHAAMAADDATAAMAHAHAHDTPSPSPAVVRPDGPHAVETETVAYATIDGKAVDGFLARPKDGRKGGPALVVIHEWWGLNDNVREMAKQFASHGYTTLAVDLYGGHAATTPDQAQALMKQTMANTAAAADNLKQAYAYLHEKRGAAKVGVLGWCFGGGWSLQTGLLLPGKIDAVVMYYGRPELDRAELSKLQAPLLGHFGEADQAIPVASVRQFEALLHELKKDATIHYYAGAGHAFANPSGTSYVKKAADEAWERTLAFLKKHLGD